MVLFARRIENLQHPESSAPLQLEGFGGYCELGGDWFWIILFETGNNIADYKRSHS